MKKKLQFIALFYLIQLTGYSTVFVVENTGTTFSPDEITITEGDTVQFTLENIHNAVEVSKATWDANGATSLAGGFSVAKGGGTVLPAKLTAGTHYYVCTPHASLGMKGTIIVKSANGIAENRVKPITIFPNPAADFITVKGTNPKGMNYSIISLDGKQVLTGKLSSPETIVFLRELPSGTYYFMAEGTERRAFAVVNP